MTKERAPDPSPDPPPAAIDWTPAGAPRAIDYDDVYYSARDGRAETAHVFHGGCGLPEAWAGRERFVIGELGFGLGLNFTATWAAWDAACARGRARGRLDYIAFEQRPPPAEAVRRALSQWPDLAERAMRWLGPEDWPPASGWSRRTLAPGVALHLAIGDANTLAPDWDAAAPDAVDAWFLDGFSPAKNPDLWSEGLMRVVGARTAPGGAAASYTAAGWVRRNLAAAGFIVSKRPGYGTKREMLTARKPALDAPDPQRP